MSRPRLTFNVEDELTVAIAPIGGRRVASFLGQAPEHENADYFFPAAQVVSELKCLDGDKISDERIIEKASRVYTDELKSGRAPFIAFGEVQLTTKDFSEEYKQKIGNLYRVPIERLARKADRQIRLTVQALKVAAPTGLFLLANNNHTALDPQHAWYIVNQILAQDEYPNINAAVVFSGNLGATLPEAPYRLDYWIEIQRSGMQPVASPFLSSLREAWHSHLAKILGHSVAPIALPTSMELLSRLESG